jgi:Spy/CpxP family protein refolding chaperone
MNHMSSFTSIKNQKMRRATTFKTFGLALLVSLFAMNISAQGQGGPGRGFQMTEDDIKEQVKNTAETLKLNDQQHKKVLAVELDFYNKRQIEFQKMRNAGGPGGDREAMREKMMKMRDERNAAYEAVLTPEQYKQFIDLQDQRRREMREQRQQGNPDGAGAREDRPARGRGRN